MATLGLGVFFGGVITGVPVVTGVAEGVSHQKKVNEEAADDTRMVTFCIQIQYLDGDETWKLQDVPDIIVLKDGKLWITQASKDAFHEPATLSGGSSPHAFSGFYIMYPDDDRSPPQRGLVSTISSNPPVLNWIYVDKQTDELRYGNRTQSIEHTVGPWDWSDPLPPFTLFSRPPTEASAEDKIRLLTLCDTDLFYTWQSTDEGISGVLKWSLHWQSGEIKDHRRCRLIRRPLPGEVRKMQEIEAENKMRVKQSGDLKTILNLRES